MAGAFRPAVPLPRLYGCARAAGAGSTGHRPQLTFSFFLPASGQDIEPCYGLGSHGLGSYGLGSYGLGSYDLGSYGLGSSRS